MLMWLDFIFYTHLQKQYIQCLALWYKKNCCNLRDRARRGGALFGTRGAGIQWEECRQTDSVPVRRSYCHTPIPIPPFPYLVENENDSTGEGEEEEQT